MEMIFDFAGSVVRLVDYLYILFVLPLGDVPAALLKMNVVAEPRPFDESLITLVSFVMDAFSNVFPWILQASLASILLGSSLAVFLLWRFLKFILPLLEAL